MKLWFETYALYHLYYFYYLVIVFVLLDHFIKKYNPIPKTIIAKTNMIIKKLVNPPTNLNLSSSSFFFSITITNTSLNSINTSIESCICFLLSL